LSYTVTEKGTITYSSQDKEELQFKGRLESEIPWDGKRSSAHPGSVVRRIERSHQKGSGLWDDQRTPRRKKV